MGVAFQGLIVPIRVGVDLIRVGVVPLECDLIRVGVVL